MSGGRKTAVAFCRPLDHADEGIIVTTCDAEPGAVDAENAARRADCRRIARLNVSCSTCAAERPQDAGASAGPTPRRTATCGKTSPRSRSQRCSACRPGGSVRERHPDQRVPATQDCGDEEEPSRHPGERLCRRRLPAAGPVGGGPATRGGRVGGTPDPPLLRHADHRLGCRVVRQARQPRTPPVGRRDRRRGLVRIPPRRPVAVAGARLPRRARSSAYGAAGHRRVRTPAGGGQRQHPAGHLGPGVAGQRGVHRSPRDRGGAGLARPHRCVRRRHRRRDRRGGPVLHAPGQCRADPAAPARQRDPAPAGTGRADGVPDPRRHPPSAGGAAEFLPCQAGRQGFVHHRLRCPGRRAAGPLPARAPGGGSR